MFTGGLFWFVMGIIFVGIAASFKIWAEDLGIKMTWWKWLLSGLWYALLIFTIALPFTLWGENESQGGVGTLLFLGVITLVLGVGLARLLWIGREPARLEVVEA